MGTESAQIVRIEIRNKVAVNRTPEVFLVGDNNDYKAVFDFDEVWDSEPLRTAIFVYGGFKPVLVPFKGNECDIPIIHNATVCQVGVTAGDIKTSTPALVSCKISIRDLGGDVEPPSEDVYNKIISLVESGMLKGEKGDQGEQGIQGEQGETGATGAKIVSTEFVRKNDNGDNVYLQTFDNGETNEFVAPVGPQGRQGEVGPQGPQGEKGEKGDQGKQGDVGPRGQQGPQGQKGPKGDKGDTGSQGVQGPQGVKGDKGDTGAKIVSTVYVGKNENGDNVYKQTFDDGATNEFVAPKGEQGEQGIRGKKGDKGDQGDRGAQGAQGEKGDKGDKGDTGLTGAKGNKGDTGKSAYDIWLEVGNVGTQTDFLASLKGEQGPQGPQGEAGKKEVILVDIAKMLGMYDGKQDVELFLNLSKRYANGEIAIIGELDTAYGVITAVIYQEDESGNVTMANWSLSSAIYGIDPEGGTMENAYLVVYGLAYDYENGRIVIVQNAFPLVTDPASQEYVDNAAGTALNSASKYTDWEINKLGASFESKILDVKDYVDEEIATFDITKIVDELPVKGLPNREYFLRKANSTDPNDLFDEYAWINRGTEEAPDWGWEFKGTKKLEVDLTDYVKKTDAAGNGKLGLVQNAKVYCFVVADNGLPRADVLSLAEYQRISAAAFVGKGTLEAAKNDIVKRGIVENDITLTDEDKTNACGWIGAATKEEVGDIETALDSIIAIQKSLIGG